MLGVVRRIVSRRQLWRLASLPLLALIAWGCVRLPGKRPKAEVKSIYGNTNAAAAITPTVLQARAMRFADEYSMVIAQAADDFAAKVGTTEARYVAARIKLGQGMAAVVNAAGQNPTVNTLDLVVLASVARIVAEDYLVGERFGEAAMPLLETSRRQETNAWALVNPLLKAEQQRELRELIEEWRRKNPHQRYVGAVRFGEFAEAVEVSPQKLAGKPTSVFSLLFLDPMAGLDPTLRAIEETRYLAERALYYGQRMPVLVSWQAEFLALQLADQPAAQQMLTNVDQLAASMQVFAKTAEQLPQLVNQQREAAIQQVFAGVANERSNILASLASEEKKMHDLMAEARGTINSANEMAGSMNTAIRSLESFMRYVSPPKTNTVAGPARTNSRPFDVLDYGTAAGQVGGMAKELNTLLTTANQSIPQATQLGQQAAANVERAVRRGFWLGLVLIAVLLVGAVLAALCYQVLVSKLVRQESAPSTKES
jgi:hypothetical protein